MVNPAGGMQEMIQKYWDFVDAKNILEASNLIDPSMTGSYEWEENGVTTPPETYYGKEAFLQSVSNVVEKIEKVLKRGLVFKQDINPNIMVVEFEQLLLVKDGDKLKDFHSKGRQIWRAINTNGNLLLCALRVIETEQTSKPHEEPAGGRTCILL